jgi:tetratricopeptide (TPR) repeat protein
MRRILPVLILFVIARTSYGQISTLEKGNKFLWDGNYLAAEEVFTRALRSDSNNVEYQSQLAFSLIFQHLHEDAQEYIDKVLLKDPKNGKVIFYGGLNSFMNSRGDLRTAINYFERATRLFDIENESNQYFTSTLYIAKSYRELLKKDGLSFDEISTMIERYTSFVWFNPKHEEIEEISKFLVQIKEKRPLYSSYVKKWKYPV